VCQQETHACVGSQRITNLITRFGSHLQESKAAAAAGEAIDWLTEDQQTYAAPAAAASAQDVFQQRSNTHLQEAKHHAQHISAKPWARET
jgi:hypothetical protein